MSPLRPGGAGHTEKDWKSTQGLSATGVGSNPHLPRRPVSTTSGRSPAPCKRGRPGTAPHGGGLEESQRSRTSPGFHPKCPVASYSPPLRKCHRFPSALRQSRSTKQSWKRGPAAGGAVPCTSGGREPCDGAPPQRPTAPRARVQRGDVPSCLRPPSAPEGWAGSGGPCGGRLGTRKLEDTPVISAPVPGAWLMSRPARHTV